LFGNPLQQAKAAQAESYNLYSKAAGASNPFAGLAGLTGMFATGAGQAARGALGVQNQEEMLGSLRQQAQQQFDTNTPEGLVQMAQFLNSKGDAAGARQAIMLAQGQQARAQQIATSRAQQIRAEREPGQLNFQQLLSSGKYTPESIAKFQQTQNPGDLVLVSAGPEKLGEATIKEIGLTEKNNRVLTNTNKVLDKYITDIDEGKLNLGWGSLTAAGVQSLGVGKVSENTQQIKNLKKFVEQERNNILMAAKGTQTEGDAERALNQILSTTDWTSNTSMSNALKNLKEYKNSQIDANNVYIDNLRGTSRKVGSQSAVSGAPTGGAVSSNAGYYAAVRNNPGWANATDKEIDDAIAAGTIKVGKKSK
jgi:hypothetical protein